LVTLALGFQDLQSLLDSEMAILVQGVVNWARETSKASLLASTASDTREGA
jgi:hypothetical protein